MDSLCWSVASWNHHEHYNDTVKHLAVSLCSNILSWLISDKFFTFKSRSHVTTTKSTILTRLKATSWLFFCNIYSTSFALPAFLDGCLWFDAAGNLVSAACTKHTVILELLCVLVARIWRLLRPAGVHANPLRCPEDQKEGSWFSDSNVTPQQCYFSRVRNTNRWVKSPPSGWILELQCSPPAAWLARCSVQLGIIIITTKKCQHGAVQLFAVTWPGPDPEEWIDLFCFALMNTAPLAGSQMVAVSPALCPRDAALWTARSGAPWQSASAAASPLLTLGWWGLWQAAGVWRWGPLRHRDPALLLPGVCTGDVAHAALEQLSKYTVLTRRRSASTQAHHVALYWQLMGPFADIKGAARGVKSPCDPLHVRSLLIKFRLQAEINSELFGPLRVTPCGARSRKVSQRRQVTVIQP